MNLRKQRDGYLHIMWKWRKDKKTRWMRKIEQSNRSTRFYMKDENDRKKTKIHDYNIPNRHIDWHNSIYNMNINETKKNKHIDWLEFI